MLTIAAILFLLTAVLGVSMATLIYADRPIPSFWMPVLHALFAVPALTLAIVVALSGHTNRTGLLWAAVALFGLAVVGGIMLLGQHLQKAGQSNGLTGFHGAVAAIGYVLVLIVLGSGG